MVPVPIGIGCLVAMGLRELYVRQGGTFEKEEHGQESAVPDSNEENREENTESEPPAPESIPPETESESSVLPSELSSSEPEVPAVVALDTSAFVPESAVPKSVFDDPVPLPADLHIDNAVEEMLDDVNPIVPADLSSRLTEESVAAQETGYKEDEDDDDNWLNEENDIMQRINDTAGEQEITFPDSAPGQDEISPMAVELLGGDFDFDSLVNSPQEAKKTENEKNTVNCIPDFSGSPEEVCQNDTLLVSGGDAEILKPEQHEIIPIFSEGLVSGAVTELCPSEVAKQFCFVEELRPMFVPKNRTRNP